MQLFIVLVALVGGSAFAKRRGGGGGSCPQVDTINRRLRDVSCDQPIFVNFITKREGVELLDNICVTYFPLPDDPDTFQGYQSRVYCDGSTEVVSFIATDFGPGTHRSANPTSGTYSYNYFGYAGCDTYLALVCPKYAATSYEIQGVSSNCKSIGLSCLRKVEEIMRENGLPNMDFYALPMKLPNRCVTQQKCIVSQANQFYKALGFAGPLNVH